MEVRRVLDVLALITQAGLAGRKEVDLLHTFCKELAGHDLQLTQGSVIVDTLHPVFEGRAFRWRRDDPDYEPVVSYGPSNQGGAAEESWRRSPFYHLVETGGAVVRRRIATEPLDFPILNDLRDAGNTDFIALIHRFESDGTIGEMDCVYSSWVTDAPGGFTEEQAVALQQLVATLALAVKSASLAQIAETLLETYLGRDAGRRVLSGRIARGVADRIGAVIWYSDLRGFTSIAEAAAPEQIIPFLNDYSEAVITSIQEAGGDVLKLIGDGILAIFNAEDPASACSCALSAERLMRERVAALRAERQESGLPATQPYLGLHIGEVFYGNIGSRDRLDFTVVGPAVNETSRIAALCRSVEKDVLVSAAFAQACSPQQRNCLVSVGRYALRGIDRPRNLFTLDKEWIAPAEHSPG
jgi:adenylate cyclase